jgi:23S rRNA (cytosine1962-C5)-methyltransferase
MASLQLRSNSRSRVLGGHPWIFAGEVKELLPESEDGQVVECRDGNGRMLGSGLYNGRSQIVWRRISRHKIEFDSAKLKSLITAAIERRTHAAPRRLIWSEADHLPGLVVDDYGACLVMQTLTLGMDQRKEEIGAILAGILGEKPIVLRNDVPVRPLEGLPEEVAALRGTAPGPFPVTVGNVEFQIDVFGGQKTGLYLDQREQYQRVAAYAAGRSVLDTFCNQGGFALHCAKAGATAVTGVDQSGPAIGHARKNAERAGLKAEFTEANVFDYFRLHRDKRYGVVILDPPPFARSRGNVEGAMRGYRELNLRAMQQLEPGGVLATYSCSHHISHDAYLEMLESAAGDARRDVTILEVCRQPSDHPILLNMPESEYLRGFILRIE